MRNPNLAPLFAKGNPGGPGRKPNAGHGAIEWFNSYCYMTEDKLRGIVSDVTLPMIQRRAAREVMDMMERPDVADFLPVIKGEKTLAELRLEGIRTESVKRLRISDNGKIDLEFHERDITSFQGIIDHTHGKPTQRIETTGSFEISTPVNEGVRDQIRRMRDGNKLASAVVNELPAPVAPEEEPAEKEPEDAPEA